MQEQDAPELERMLIRSLELEDQQVTPTGHDLAAVRAFLQSRISALLKTDMSRLVNLMYRMDIPEKLFDEAMKLPEKERVIQIAELVLQREFRRLEWRKKYSQRPPDE